MPKKVLSSFACETKAEFSGLKIACQDLFFLTLCNV